MKSIFVIILTTCMSVTVSGADIPSVITHQGYITDKNGLGITGELNFSIGIYKSLDGDDLLWEEDLGTVNVKDGFYFIRVGDKGGLSDIFSGYSVLFLEVRINGKALSPRQAIGSVPYAFVSNDAVGDIHPRSVIVGGRKVIDENGRWAGDIPLSKADANTDGYLSKEDYAKFGGKQERVSGSCNLGMCMVSVNADGSVNCEPCGGGGGGVYTAGAGLVLQNTEFSLDPIYLSGSAYDNRFVNVGEENSISNDMIQDRAVTFNKMANNGCAANQYIKWDGANWSCGSITGGGTVTQINTAAPLVGGPITTSGTISLPAASSGTDGYLTSTDYRRFEAKQDALGYTPVNRAGDSMTGALNLPANGLTVGGTQLAATGGNIGINTGTPAAKLDVAGSSVFSTNVTIRGDLSEGGQLVLNDTDTYTSGESTNSWNIDVVGTKGSGQLRFHRSTNGTKMVINADGKVGIGTTTPDQMLTVNGRIKATQGITVYECPRLGDIYYCGSTCIGQLSLSSTCTYYEYSDYCYGPYTASCTAKGFLIDR
ncbi:MAG: hypothetical protein ACP5KG_02120 [Myxococcota bacterium]